MKKLLLAAVLAAVAVVIVVRANSPAVKPYVFVNQTGDHRFDDSIRTTILANQKRAGVQNAVVIAAAIPRDLTAESWAAQLFKELGLGAATGGKAILYLYVPPLKQLKIEVGYALEGVMPDITVHALEEAAKSFTYSHRMHDFWADLINTINVYIYNQQNNLPAELDFKNWRYLSGGAGVSRADYEVSADQLRKEFKALPSGDLRYQPGGTARETLELYLKSLREGVGDAGLGLLSTGSRLYREHSPLNQALLQRMWQMYDRASPYNLIEEGPQAVAKFKDAHPVLPIFLFRAADGMWRVHEPYSFSLFNRFEDSMSVFQTHPVAGGLLKKTGLSTNVIFWGGTPFTPDPAEGEEFFLRLRRLEAAAKQGDTSALFTLGDFYLFEMWNYEQAAEFYAKSLEKNPDQPERLWRSLAPLMAAGRMRDFLSVYERLTKLQPGDRRLKTNYDFYLKTFAFPKSEWRSAL